MALTEEEAAKILLVRSVEESDKNAFSANVLTSALKQAGANVQGTAWFLTRASYLLEHLPGAYRSILYVTRLPGSWVAPISVLALVVGFGTNLLGPTDKIHVIYNPVLFLVAWNLIIYLALLVALCRRRDLFRALARRREIPDQAKAMESASRVYERSDKQPRIPWLAEFFIPGVWKLLHRLQFAYWQTRAFSDAAGRFWSYWLTVAGPLVLARWKAMLHFGAVSLAVGATAGMYFRGLFQGYQVVWGSTFITSRDAVATSIDVVFAPAFLLSRLMGQDLRGRVDIGGIMSPQGDPAAPWIHLFAITVVLVVVLPRAALVVWQGARIQKLKNNLPLLFDRYYGALIESPIRSRIEEEIRRGIAQFAQSVSSFVRTELYDKRIVLQLESFRENGGRVADLRSRIKEATETFAPQLQTFVSERAAPEFQRSATVGVEKIIEGIRTDFSGLKEPVEFLAEIRIETPGAFANAMGRGYSDAFSAAIAASIAIALGTISGGFGVELEIAIIAALLGTTGPIGFVIGALVGVLIAGAGWWFGREKITEFVESVELPGAVVRATLWESRFQNLVADGRKQCEESVKAKAAEQMEPLVPRITEEVLLGVRRLWNM